MYKRIVLMLSSALNQVSLFFITALMFLTATDVFGRYVLDKPVMGSFEITEYMMTILVALSLAYCAMEKGHISIDLVVEHLPLRARAIAGSITYFIGAGFFAVVSWQSFIYVKMQFISRGASVVLRISEYPFIAVVAIGTALLSMAFLVFFLDYLSQAVKR